MTTTEAAVLLICHECDWQGENPEDHSGTKACVPGASLAGYHQ